MQFSVVSILALAASATATPTLSPRGDDGLIECTGTTTTKGEVARENMVEGQEYLRGLGAACGADAGHCSRVSCSNDASIWLCNNSGSDISGIDCGLLADYIDNIYDQCQHNSQYFYQLAEGYQENSDGWAVNAGYNTC